MFRIICLAAAIALGCTSAHAQTKEQWIELGARIHGGFGVLIPIGIKIGLDAKERLKAEPRTLLITYYTGEKAPCPCIADGVMLGTGASPGQGSLLVAPEKAPAGLYAMIVVCNRKTSEAVRYSISDKLAPTIIEWNKSLDPAGRYDAVMGADGLFQVEPVTQ